MDRIFIHDLLLRCHIGVTAEERQSAQDVLVNLSLSLDLRQAGQTDDIADTLDYRALKKEIISVVEASSYALVEALAERIAQVCLGVPTVQHVTVRVEKPGALRFARSVGVEIVRERP